MTGAGEATKGSARAAVGDDDDKELGIEDTDFDRAESEEDPEARAAAEDEENEDENDDVVGEDFCSVSMFCWVRAEGNHKHALGPRRTSEGLVCACKTR